MQPQGRASSRARGRMRAQLHSRAAPPAESKTRIAEGGSRKRAGLRVAERVHGARKVVRKAVLRLW